MKTNIVILSLLIITRISCLSQDAGNQSFNFDLAVKAAQENLAAGNYEEARVLCRRVLRDVPDYNDARLILGNSYAFEGNYEDARRIYLELFDFNQAYKPGLMALANLEIWDRRPDEAIGICESALGYFPDDIDFLMLHAKASALGGRLESAKKSIYQILVQDKNHTEAKELYYKIRDNIPFSESSYLGSGRPDLFTFVNIDSLMARANNLAWSQDYQGARSLTGQILQRNPAHYPAIILNANTFAWENDFESARREISRFDPFAIPHKEGINTAISIETLANNYDQAIALCNKARKVLPEDNEYVLKTAEIYSLKGDYLQAKRTIYNRLLQGDNSPELISAYRLILNQSLQARNTTPQQTLPVADQERLASLMENAQNQAFDGLYDEALATCDEILNLSPGYFSALYLRGSIYAWTKRYTEALAIYQQLFSMAFDNYDLIGSMVDLHTWMQNYDKAIEMADYGLAIYPDDYELRYKRGLAYQRTGQSDLASEEFNALLGVNPDDKRISNSYYAMKGPLPITGVSGEYTFNGFNVPFKRHWHMYSLRYYQTNSIGTFIGSTNIGYVDNDTTTFMQGGGVQFEIDAWPKFPQNKRYFHFNVGVSPSPIFARFRLGGHIYQELAAGWEASGGFNYSYFKSQTSTDHLIMFDATLAKFFPRLMTGLTVNYAPVNGNLAQGYTLFARKFFNQADDWVQLSIGTGIYPDNPAYYANDPTYIPTRMLNSLNLMGAARYQFATRWIGQIYTGINYEEYKAKANRVNYNLNIALIYLLRDY